MHHRERFHVRGVDEERRRYFFMTSLRGYFCAAFHADVARYLFGHHVVVWDDQEQRVLYDSRLHGSAETK